MPKPSGPTTFDLKSADLPLLQMVLRTSDIAAIAADFRRRYAGASSFFDNDPVLIELGRLPANAGAVDFKALKRLLRPYKLLPIAFSGETPEQYKAATDAGLIRATDAQVPASAAQPAHPEPEAPAVSEPQPPLVVDRPVRSGQQVYARGRDLVVTATVSAGAEVIADGNIHVYGHLRGKALAGARGDTKARIFTTHLSAELISVAGMYRTSEKPLPIDVDGKAAQVLLSDGNLLMLPLGG